VGTPGCHHGSCGLPARPEGVRGGGFILGSSGLPDGYAARPSAKKGSPSAHPIIGDELRALRRLKREQEPKSAFVFTSERGAPFSTAGFARMVERAGKEAKFAFKAHPHMLRHACGYALANKGHDTRALQAYLGHRNIQHTVKYTELSPTRFKDFHPSKRPINSARGSGCLRNFETPTSPVE
jgi:integrase